MSAIPREELTRRLCRECARFRFSVNAEITFHGQKRWGRVTDVSRNGLFIEMDEPPARGAHFTALLALNVPLQLHCDVKRLVPALGIGVAIAVPHDSKLRFEALLTALSAGADPAANAAKANFPDAPRPRARAAAAANSAGASAVARKR